VKTSKVHYRFIRFQRVG